GRPISFVQDLYQPLYIPRPVVQPELYASLNPQTYEGGIAANKANRPMQMARRMGAAGGGGAGGELSIAAAAPAAPPADGVSAFGMPMEKPMDAAASVASVASAGKIGELFQYTVSQPVTLPRQKSAMLPIITDDIECEKL